MTRPRVYRSQGKDQHCLVPMLALTIGWQLPSQEGPMGLGSSYQSTLRPKSRKGQELFQECNFSPSLGTLDSQPSP